jgi:penicillin-binding protein 2
MLVLDQLRKNDPALRVLAWGIAAGLLILLAGLYYVQVVSASRYREEQKNQSFRSVRLPAVRGKILDRRGIVLAENRPSYHISLYLEDRAIRDRFKQRYGEAKGRRRLTREQQAQLGRATRYEVASHLVAQVSQVLREPVSLSEPQFTRHYDRSLALPLPILGDLKLEQIARVAEATTVPPGVDLEIRPMRTYPYHSTAAHVLGGLRRDEGSSDEDEIFFNYRLPDYMGDTGIEYAFNDDLKGRPGAKSVLVNSLGYRQSENVWSPVLPGRNLKLTLDLQIQKAAEHGLGQALKEARGAAVVLDVQSGDVLAMASAPSYDPNDWIPRLTYNVWTNLTNETLRPLVNRAAQGAYAPASVFKIIVGLAALEAGWNATNIITSPGYAQVANHPMGDTAPAGDYDFKRALKLSCNKYFVDAGVWVGIDRIVAMAQRFHFGQKTGIPLRAEAAGVLPTREWIRNRVESGYRGPWRDGDTANVSIGQGDITVTPLQVALMVAAVANGGTMLAPRLVAEVTPQDPFDRAAPRVFPPGHIRSQVGVSARSLSLLREAMLADVEDRDGTGHLAFHRFKGGPPILPDFRVAAKTGTAEVLKGHTMDSVTWFVSFGPYENPRYAVVVVVESGGSGGRTCGPAACKIYQAILACEKAVAPAPTAQVATR